VNLDLTDEERSFRDEARTWLREHLPTEPRPPEGDEMRAFDLAWQRTLHDGGWAGINWPREYGGRGLSDIQQMIWYEEFALADPPFTLNNSCTFVGNNHGGPTLIACGDEEQKATHLPPILRGEVVWCQGFSEPGAGSDLASLSTRAEVDGDELVVTGQKVWTTMARESQWGICLARTDPDAPKHDGITCFLVDMSTPGIDVRPLRELTGFALFNEVFLDGVVVPDELVVGEVGGGWQCARTTLENERVSMSSGSSFGPGIQSVLDLAARGGRIADPLVRDEVGGLLATSSALAVTGLRSTLRALAGAGGASGGPGPEASVRKLVGVEHEQRVQEVGMELLGPWAVVDRDEGARWFGGFLGNRALSIAGGTSEIQRNVVAERLLGLPRDP